MLSFVELFSKLAYYIAFSVLSLFEMPVIFVGFVRSLRQSNYPETSSNWTAGFLAVS